MKKSILLISIVLIPIILFSCKDDEINSPINLVDDKFDNIPVIVNTQNSFTFTIVADNITYTKVNNLNFTKDSLVTTITLINVSSRGSSFELFDGADNSIFTESLNENKVSVNTEVNGSIPEKLMIDLKDFSGKLTIVVAPKNPR